MIGFYSDCLFHQMNAIVEITALSIDCP